jgi:hypothetical protein
MPARGRKAIPADRFDDVSLDSLTVFISDAQIKLSSSVANDSGLTKVVNGQCKVEGLIERNISTS